MKDMVLLNYTFLFNPVETWQHLSQFEDELANFFRDRGFDAEIIKSIGGQSGQRILHICKTPTKAEKAIAEKPKDPKKQLDMAMKKAGGK